MDDSQQRKDIGTFFTQFRYKKNLTQRQLGQMVGIGQAAITTFEKGQHDFRFSTLLRLARTYGYRLELRLVPLEGDGDSILIQPDPSARTRRTYGGNTFTRDKPRKASKPTVKKEKKDIPAVKYEDDEKFDSKAELARLREQFNLPPR